MESFNEKLREIRILEMISVTVLSVFLIGLLELNIEWIPLLIILYFLFRTRKELKGLKICIKNLFSKITLKTWLLLSISSYIFSLGCGVFLSKMFPDELYILGAMITLTDTMANFGADFIFTAILGPITEELMFRGVLLNRLNKRLPLIVSIILSSLLFSLFHPQDAILSAFIFGVTMAIAYLVTENIMFPITLHMLNNIISMSFPYIPNLELFLNSEIGMVSLAILTVISLIYILRFVIVNYAEIES